MRPRKRNADPSSDVVIDAVINIISRYHGTEICNDFVYGVKYRRRLSDEDRRNFTRDFNDAFYRDFYEIGFSGMYENEIILYLYNLALGHWSGPQDAAFRADLKELGVKHQKLYQLNERNKRCSR